MDSHSGAMVTIDRDHFDTLVRRANFNLESQNSESPAAPVALSAPAPAPTVAVLEAEYASLKQIAQQYANLRQNLLRGGVDEQTVALLSQGDGTAKLENLPPPVVGPDRKGAGDGTGLNSTPNSPSRGGSRGASHWAGHQTDGAARQHHETQDWADADPTPDDTSYSVDALADGCGVPANNGGGQQQQHHQPSKPQFDRQCTRTIQLMGLPEGVAHADITAVVRGGMVLDVFLRTGDRSAMVSFLHAVDARAFFNHAKKHDLYIKKKRIEVRWSDRQFILPAHVASKIGIGATRNLVIRRCDGRMTEDIIRDDLEHIHNLVVIKVEFVGSSCYIRTNSVHNAMFARTCMMSRLKYKGSKIEWDADECSQSLGLSPVLSTKPRKEPQPAKKAVPATAAVGNRFQLLNLDDDDDTDEITSAFHRAKNSVGITA